MNEQNPQGIMEGASCLVIAGVHKGKTGIASNFNTSKTGIFTITVTQANGVRFKTLARNAEKL